MKTLAARELAERINEILRRVEEDGETFEVTNHDEVCQCYNEAKSKH